MTPASPLLSCLRWDDAGDNLLKSLTADQWNELWTLLKADGGVPFLARRLHQTGIRAPAPINEQMRTHLLRQAARNLTGQKQIFDAIRATGRPALLLKGADIANRVYGNLGLRPMGDIDVLVRQEDVPLFVRHFVELGYSCTPAFHEQLFELRSHRDLVFHPPAPHGMRIELHWRLTHEDEDEDCGIDKEGIWQRALQADKTVGNAYVMSPEDLLVYLCVHLKHHAFDTSLTQLWDLAELLSASSMQFDWPTVWRRAQEWQATASLNIALYLLSRTLGVETRHLSDWEPDAQLAANMPNLLANLGRYPLVSKISRPNALLFLSSSSSPQQRMQTLYRKLLPSKENIIIEFGEIRKINFTSNAGLYMQYWARILYRSVNTSIEWLHDHKSLRREGERQVALRRYLEQNQ